MLEWPWITIHVRHCDPGLTGALTEQMGETVTMSLAANMPLLDTGGEPGFVRDFAQAAEDLGYDGLALPDHVLGANIANRPDWGDRNTSADFFHDPFVLFGRVHDNL